MNNFYIIKSSGQAEQFDVEKLRNSLRRSGADETLVNQVLQELEGQWHEGISTKSIYKRAFKLLKRLHRPTAARYTLKQAMFDLGPTGFPFEDFFAEILKNRGYEVQTRVVLPGACVRHEVDVMGEKDRTLIWAECKYHPQPGSVSNVKIPLYFHSRFRDLQAQLEKNPDRAGWRSEGWLVTNTRFSDDAAQYGHCAGLHLIGWNYPSGDSLRELIDDAGLHPVTCLTTLTRREKSVLLEQGFVLSRTLSEPGNWSEIAHISGERQISVMQEAQMLCRR